MLCCVVVFYFILFYFMLLCFDLFCFVLHCFVLTFSLFFLFANFLVESSSSSALFWKGCNRKETGRREIQLRPNYTNVRRSEKY